MRTRQQRMLGMAVLTMALIGSSLATATPAAAAAPPASCPNHYICFYEHTNFNRVRIGDILPIHVDKFRNCAKHYIGVGNGVSSVHNNTDAHVQLWDLFPSPDDLVGTAVRRKWYADLGAGNDKTDMVAGYGCHP
jgi:Peptidase inhibitor family I36